ncbi:MAG: single-stranded-DNA-specific exonuclease RecJ [Candidatus Vogelbacteria bacterium]|nr:single-stranded-DNA-specific exonuclease RecJ [Candidatus Vogelbacteria bacterium]
MQKSWLPRSIPAEHNLSVNSDLLRQLLVGRGITDQSAAERFLAPDYERDLHDPFLMLDMDRAAARILAAVRDGERIAIFADYDADGVPAAAILTAFFRRINFSNFTVYIPDRHEESYGLNNQALAQLAVAGVKLVITVDCGVTDVAAVAEATRLGLEVIITDHHLVPEAPPAAYAIINPKRPGDPYPYKMLAGAGVAFKLVQGLVQFWWKSDIHEPWISDFHRVEPGWEKWLLDLVAIATVSDMVPLTGENRALVHFGLKVLRRTPRLGLQALFRVLNLTPEFITEDDIGFLIGPRLNSASRMSHGREAYALLTADDEVEADRLARHLEAKNKERRASVAAILETVRSDSATAAGGVVLVAGELNWPLGVLGLAASRLAEERRRPVFLWGQNGRGEIRGSCRSDGAVNVVELMAAAEALAGGGLFLNHGGHAGAGGFSLAPERLPELAPCLSEAYRELKKFPAAETDSLFDLEWPAGRVGEEIYAVIERLAPFGPENPRPVFHFPRLPLTAARRFGNGANHFEFVLPGERLGRLRAVQFFPISARLPNLGEPIDLLANLEKSYYRGRSELRLRIVDWRESL